MRSDSFTLSKTYIFSFTAVVFVFLIITTLLIPHRETDEVIYQTLGIKLANLQPFNLQGTAILPYLSQTTYNTPLFFRPPAFMVYLAVLYKLLGTVGMHLAPVLVFIFLCLVIYKTTQLITKPEQVAVKALLLSLVSTQLVFASTKIHLDLFLTLMIAVSFLFLVIAKERKKMSAVFLSGLFLVFAVLSKYTAVIFYPLFAGLLHFTDKKSLVKILFFLIPSVLLIGWFYYILIVAQLPYDVLVSAPDKEMLAKYPFVKYVHDRPFFFYFINVFLVNPIYLLLFVLLKKNVWSEVKQQYGIYPYFFIATITVVLLALTYFGIRGVSYQMRYILPAEPFFIMLLALIPFEKYEWMRYFLYAAIIYNVLTILYNFGKAEVFSFFEMALRAM